MGIAGRAIVDVLEAEGIATSTALEMPGFLAPRTDEVVTELFVRELTEGINDTGVRAAFLKCAVESHGLIGDVPRILGTIAAAAVQTGVPVMVHTNADYRTGLPAMRTADGGRRRPVTDRDRACRRQQ